MMCLTNGFDKREAIYDQALPLTGIKVLNV